MTSRESKCRVILRGESVQAPSPVFRSLWTHSRSTSGTGNAPRATLFAGLPSDVAGNLTANSLTLFTAYWSAVTSGNGVVSASVSGGVPAPAPAAVPASPPDYKNTAIGTGAS